MLLAQSHGHTARLASADCRDATSTRLTSHHSGRSSEHMVSRRSRTKRCYGRSSSWEPLLRSSENRLQLPCRMAYSRSMTSPLGTQDKPSAGDPLPPKCSVIEVHVGELKQL